MFTRKKHNHYEKIDHLTNYFPCLHFSGDLINAQAKKYRYFTVYGESTVSHFFEFVL